MSITIHAGYFESKRTGRILDGRTIVHEMGYASLGLSDRLPDTANNRAAASSSTIGEVVFGIDKATGLPVVDSEGMVIYGYRKEGLKRANSAKPPVENFNDRMTCTVYKC